MKKLMLGWLLFLFVSNAYSGPISGAFGINLGQSINVFGMEKFIEPGGVLKLETNSELVSEFIGIQEYEPIFDSETISELRSLGRIKASDHIWIINEEVFENELGYVDSDLELLRHSEVVMVFDSEYYPSQILFDIAPESMSSQELEYFQEFKVFDRLILSFDIDRSGYATNLGMFGVFRQVEEYELLFGDSYRKMEGYLFEPNVPDELFDNYGVSVSAISKKVFEISAFKYYELHNSLCLIDFATLKDALDSKYRLTDRVIKKQLVAALEVFGEKLTAVEAYRSNGRGVYLSCAQNKFLGSETLGLIYFDHTMQVLIDEEYKEYQEQEFGDILQ